MKRNSLSMWVLLAAVLLPMGQAWAEAGPGTPAPDRRAMVEEAGQPAVPLADFLASLGAAVPDLGSAELEGLDPSTGVVPASHCGEEWCSFEHEQNCAATCFPCDYQFTCNHDFCFDRCRCIFSTCPV